MPDYQAAKALVQECYRDVDSAGSGVATALARHVRSDYRFHRGVHPFNQLAGAEAVLSTVWDPLRRALTSLQRREDVFMAGSNELDGQSWVCSMGHPMGLHDQEWLGIHRRDGWHSCVMPSSTASRKGRLPRPRCFATSSASCGRRGSIRYQHRPAPN